MKDTNYFTIQGWMIKKELSLAESSVWGLIYGFSQDGESEYYGSVRYIAEALQISNPTVVRILKKLIKLGYIRRTKESHYTARVLKNLAHPVKEPCTVGVKEPCTNKYNTNNKISNTFLQKDIADNNGKIKELQTMIDKKGAGFKKTQPKPKGRNARAFTNEARKRAGKEPMQKDQLLQLLTYWQKYNPAFNPLNKTERDPAKKLLEMWGNDWKRKLDLVFKVQEYKYCKIIATTPKEVFKNYTALKLTLKKQRK